MNIVTKRPEAGEFRVLGRVGALSRLVVVSSMQNPNLPKTHVFLVTNELEYGTDWDVRVDPEDSGLAYPVLIETDLYAPSWERHLGEPLGRLAAKFLGLLDPVDTDFTNVTDLQRGIPLCDLVTDTRNVWKYSEWKDLAELHAAGEGIEE